jgi:hypothetical protein
VVQYSLASRVESFTSSVATELSKPKEALLAVTFCVLLVEAAVVTVLEVAVVAVDIA